MRDLDVTRARRLGGAIMVALTLPSAGMAQGTDAVPVLPPQIVSGLVTGRGPTDPLGDALVYVKGETFTAVTDSLGRYALPLPPGIWLLSVFHPRAAEMGLEQPPTSLVAVNVGESQRVDFALDQDALGSQSRPYALEAMEVVVSNARAERELQSGTRMDVLDRRVLEERRPTARHVGDLIQGEFLGVRVRQYSSNDVCIESPRGALIRDFRGVSPTSCLGRVAVVLDGILVDDAGGWLASLSPQAIESVEFLPAYAATTRYGRRASNGVLFIYTR
jgi:hypothetical protein